MCGPEPIGPRWALTPRQAIWAFGAVLLIPIGVGAISGCGSTHSAPTIAPAPGGGTATRPTAAVAAEFPQRHALERGERDAYAGSGACAECHPREAAQQRTHHARTLQLASASARPWFSLPARVRDAELNVAYSPAKQGDHYSIRAAEGGSAEQAAVEYAFGSGHHCQTYVGSYEGRPVEFRISYYSGARRWDYTPGHEVGHPVTAPLGRILEPDRVEACFSCHSTAVVVENGRTAPEQSLFGVGCESCHGPGRAHIDAVRHRATDLKMVRYSGMRNRVTEELCGQCHRTRENVEDPQNKNATSQLPRFQGAALAYSKCFTASNGRLSCVTCHDPHRDAADTTPAAYNRICASCHTAGQADQKACKTASHGDCVSCHMPYQGVKMPTGLQYRNHWIKVWKPASR